MSNKQTILFFGLIAALGITAFAAGYLLRNEQLTYSASYPLFQEAYQILKDNSLREPPTPPSLEYGMIRGMLQVYADPYTIFVEPNQSELDSNALQGSYGGIGVQIEHDRVGYALLYPFPESPAEASGIKDGDRLLKVDGVEIPPGTQDDVILSAIRGPVGETVLLVIAGAPDFALREVLVKRAEFTLPSVIGHIAADHPQIGVIKISLIADSTAGEIQKTVRELTEQGAAYFVLDLRSNPGGLLNSAVEIARLFLERGEIVTESFRGKEAKTYNVETPGSLSEIPLIILVDENSASAAEIIAGALQAQHRAELVGSPTYGKDSIQLVFSLSDKSSLHITAAKWSIPNLPYNLGENGLQPDILVLSPEGESVRDEPMDRAVERLLAQP